MTLAALGVAGVGAILPATPMARTLGFAPLPGTFFAALVGMVVAYLVLIELAKSWFFRTSRAHETSTPVSPIASPPHRQLRRRARRFSTLGELPRRRGAPAEASR